MTDEPCKQYCEINIKVRYLGDWSTCDRVEDKNQVIVTVRKHKTFGKTMAKVSLEEKN